MKRSAIHNSMWLLSPVDGVFDSWIVYVNAATSLSCILSFTAIALIVVVSVFSFVPVIRIGPLPTLNGDLLLFRKSKSLPSSVDGMYSLSVTL